MRPLEGTYQVRRGSLWIDYEPPAWLPIEIEFWLWMAGLGGVPWLAFVVVLAVV